MGDNVSLFSLSIIDKQKQANSIKNRYRNVLPYDEHRVTLNQQPGDPFSDYINASFIDGYSQTHEFVAAQGQLRSHDHIQIVELKIMIPNSNRFPGN